MAWSIRSKDVKEIVDHLTRAENDKLLAAARRYGVWCATTGAIPIGLSVAFPSPFNILLAVVLLTIHLIRIPFYLRWQKKFLCSTDWAKEHGYDPEKLKLVDIRRNTL